jgi:hypothetical protein
MEFSKRIAVVVFILVILGATVSLSGQDARGRIQGMVADTTGGVVPGVSLTLANDATGVTATRESSDNGRYLFDRVDPGNYTLTVNMPGFATHVQRNIRVGQRGDVTVDLTLKVSEIADTVTVETSPVAVKFNTADSALTMEQTLFKELPLRTRNPAALAALDPSVNGDWNRNANFDHYAANAYDLGGRTQGRNDVLIDGSPLANSAKLGYNPSVEAVQEYSVRQNAIDAEFGHSAGGIITMSMKSGTNDIHGSAYYFGANPDWNAVTNRITRQHSEPTFWNWGASVGMPIVKNKLFLFTSFEKQLDASFGALTATLPTALERQGDFSQSVNANGTPRVIYDPLTSRIEGGKVVRDPFPGNVIPANRRDPLSRKILDNLWDPNDPGDNLTGLNNYRFALVRNYRYYNLSNRVDWNVNEQLRAHGRVSFFRTNQDADDYTNGQDVLKMRRTEGSLRHGTNIAGDVVYAYNPTTVVTVRGSYYKTEDKRVYPEMDIGEEGLKNLWPNGWWQPYAKDRPILYFPNIQVRPSADIFGVRNFWYQEPLGYAFGGLVNKTLTNHSLKFGVDTRYKRGWAARFPGVANLEFRFDETGNTSPGASSNTGHQWASFLLGTMNPSASFAQFVPLQYSNTEMYALYVQDDYKVNRNLTLNFGLRYEFEDGIWDPENRIPQRLDLTDPIPGMQAAIDPVMASVAAGGTGKTVAQLMGESQGQKSFLYNGAFYFTEDGAKRATKSFKYQFMPRVGLAYRLDDKTSLRVGYGRFFTPNSVVDNGNEPLGSLNLAAFSPITQLLPDQEGRPQAFFSDPFPQGLTQAYGKSYGRYTNLGDNISLAKYERRPPISDRVNLSLQRGFWGGVVLDGEYLLNLVSQDMLNVNLNMADPRLTYKYGAELSKQVANPFYDYGTPETFPGGLRKLKTVSVATLLRPYPQYGNINQTHVDLGKYRNQSFRLRLQAPVRRDFSLLASYAYNRARSQVWYDDQDQYDRILTWQDDENSLHRVVTSGAYQLPFGRGRILAGGIPRGLDYVIGGWQIAGIYTYRGGQLLNFGAMIAPESVTRLGGVGRGAQWFDTTGFARLPAHTRRSNPVSYSNLRGPSYSNVDLVLSKKFHIREEMNLEFRLEAYNAVNNMNWANPNLTVTSSDFGVTNGHYGGHAGRRLQYMLRFQF